MFLIYFSLALTLLCSMGPLDLRGAELCVEVTDYGNLPLRESTITVSDIMKDGRYAVVTDGRGKVCLSQIAEGTYSVEAGKTGFVNVRYFPIKISVQAITQLSFRLPLGEMTMGEFGLDALVSGRLVYQGRIVKSATICVADPNTKDTCTVTNDLGEYAFSVNSGVHSIEIRMATGDIYRLKLSIPAGRIYHDWLRITKAERYYPIGK